MNPIPPLFLASLPLALSPSMILAQTFPADSEAVQTPWCPPPIPESKWTGMVILGACLVVAAWQIWKKRSKDLDEN
jgi:hypothetical protein